MEYIKRLWDAGLVGLGGFGKDSCVRMSRWYRMTVKRVNATLGQSKKNVVFRTREMIGI